MPSQGMAGGAEMQRSAGGQQVLHRFSQGDSVHHKASATAPTQPAKIVGFFTRPGALNTVHHLEIGAAWGCAKG